MKYCFAFVLLLIAYHVLPERPIWSIRLAIMALVCGSVGWVEMPTDRPAARPTDRPTDRPPDRPAARPAARPTARPAARPAPEAPTTSSNVVEEAFDVLVALGCKKTEAKRLLASVASRHFGDAQSIIEAVYKRA